MEEKIKLYYSSQIDTPWAELKRIRFQLRKLKEAGIPVRLVDTASMDDQQIFEHYMEATYPSVRKQYQIRQIFGTQSKSGGFFGKNQPALLVYQKESKHPVDVYPHDENGKRISIEDFLEQKIRELIPQEQPATTYSILDTFTCSVEQILEDKAYLRLRKGFDTDRDLCLEYPAEELKKNLNGLREDMFLRCEIREFDDDNLTFYFEESEPKVLSLDERQSLLEKYKGLFDEDK